VCGGDSGQRLASVVFFLLMSLFLLLLHDKSVLSSCSEQENEPLPLLIRGPGDSGCAGEGLCGHNNQLTPSLFGTCMRSSLADTGGLGLRGRGTLSIPGRISVSAAWG
jgi:hypothetical protein